MRDLLNLVEAASKDAVSLKKNIIDLVKATEEGTVLSQVLKVLKAGNLDQRVVNVVQHDADAKLFIKQIADAIIQSDASIEQKNEFLEKFPKGLLDTKKLLDGKAHSIEDIVGAGFPAELFKDLAVRLASQGVGPGEVALAIMSPKIKWSGRLEGGGDIIVNGRPIEVKTRVASGGRWLNPRKAKMDLQRIKETVENATGMEVPDRLNVNAWVNTYRPAIKDKKTLDTVAKTIANSLFNATNTSDYQKALKTGSAVDIIDEHLRTGFDNYKNLSKFEGILLMDLPTDTLQYFTDYDDMAGKIKHDSVYLYGPEGEVMPKVTLTTGMAAPGGKGTKGLATEPAKMGKGADLTKAAGALTGAPTPKAAPAKEPVVGVGRQKRK